MSSHPISKSGLSRSASLLRALGTKAAPVWAELASEDAAAIAEAMENAPQTETGTAAATALLQDAATTKPDAAPVWAQLSRLRVEHLAGLIENEHPQVIALTLSRIEPQAAAALVRQFPALMATDVLQRMLHMAPIHAAALTAIEASFATRLETLATDTHTRPDATVARIFDAMPADVSQDLLSALHTVEPGADERVRALMFTFADLATLSPAGLQTLLSRTPRATLTLALKGVSGEVAEAFFKNMTARARDVLREEIVGLGPRTRSDVEAARTELVTLTRTLIDSGDIHPSGGNNMDEDLIA